MRSLPLFLLLCLTGCPESQQKPSLCHLCKDDQPNSQVARLCSQDSAAINQRLWPKPGELYYMQLGLSGFGMGEAAIVVAPDGTTVLLDVGDEGHYQQIQGQLNKLFARMNQTTGFATTAPDQVDYIVLTHFHADHAGGLEQLLRRLDVAGGVVHRGYVDLAAADTQTVAKVCESLRSVNEMALCRSQQQADCDPAGWVDSYQATACSTHLANEALNLGEGFRVNLLAANGWMDGQAFADLGENTHENFENARSIVGLIEHGLFQLLFSGDLTGGGAQSPDVEAFYLEHMSDTLGLASGVDVLHISHHGRNTSTSSEWVNALLPKDGLSRNAVLGVNPSYMGAPHAEVLKTLLAGERLHRGWGWTTAVAPMGADHDMLQNANNGSVVVRTLDQGDSYAIQIVARDGTVKATQVYRAKDSCR